MAATGRLSAAQRTAIQAGNAVRQEWYIFVPIDSAHSGYTGTILDNGIFPAPGSEFQRVVKAGQRSHKVWNPTPNVKVTPTAARYSFVCDNSDGRLYENSADNLYQVPSVFQAIPQECYIRHRIYVAIYASSGTTWSQLAHMEFQGQIMDIRHEDTGNSKKEIVSATTTITCEQKGAWDTLRRTWKIEDGIDAPMTNGGVDYDWRVP